MIYVLACILMIAGTLAALAFCGFVLMIGIVIRAVCSGTDFRRHR